MTDPLDPITLHEEGRAAMFLGQYAEAELKFRMAATVALTSDGKRALLEKADEAHVLLIDSQELI